MTQQHPTIGSLLRALRARNDWTLKEMSQRCGIPLSTLSKVENDRLTLTYDKLQQISQRLNIRMSELFAEDDNTPEPPVTVVNLERSKVNVCADVEVFRATITRRLAEES